MRVRNEDGPDILTLVEAGGLARHGFNSAGVALTANFLACDRDFTQSGVPLAILRRKILEQSSLAHAARVLGTSERSCSNNIMLSQADGEALDLECVPNEMFWIQPEGGLLAHSNHFISSVARARVTDTYFGKNPDTLYRVTRVHDYLAARRGRIDYKDMVDALSDRYGFPDSVLRSPKPAAFDAISATVCMTVIDARLGKMWIARKPYERIDFAEYAIAARTAARPVDQLAA
jgi:isopenicillin-N N-acyltransferase-like protein